MNKCKKTIASLLVAFFAMTSLFQGVSFAQNYEGTYFTDGTGHWAQYYMERIRLECGVLGYFDASGKPTRMFGPDNLIKRAELAKMLAQCHEFKNHQVDQKPFFDVDVSTWFASAVTDAKDAGWIKGYPDGSFRPMNLVNRAEASQMIVNSFVTNGEVANTSGDAFWDIPSGYIWYGPAVYYAYNHFWIDGYKNEYGFPTGEFGPTKNMTRAEAAKIIIKIIDELYYDNNPPPSPVPPPAPAPSPNPNPSSPSPSPNPPSPSPNPPSPSPNPPSPSPNPPSPSPNPPSPSPNPPSPSPNPPPPVPPSPPPSPVAGHPSMWLTADDLPKLRSWAVASNPIYQNGLLAVATQMKNDMDSGKLNQDDGSFCCTVVYPREMYAMFFAFMSLIENDQSVRDDYANRARTLLMYVMNEAVKGVDDSQPYRHHNFSHADRAHFWGESFALTVDWIYPYLTAADKVTIRTVFLRWSQEIINDGYTHPQPVGVLNDPSILHLNEQGKGTYRFGVNNHDTIFERNLGLMSMSLDLADDPNGQLRAYLNNATGAWLYRTAHVIQNDLNADGLSGDWPEGWEYTPSGSGSLAHFLLALHTKGLDDSAVYGQQVKVFDNSFFKNSLTAYIHSFSPVAIQQPSYEWKGKSFLPAWYGDGQEYFQEHAMKYFGALGLYFESKNDTASLQKVRWIMLNLEPGSGEADKVGKLIQRMKDSLGSSSPRNAIFSFMLFDPAQLTPSDPRPSMPTTYFGKATNRLLSRTSWSPDARWFTYKLTWNKIDHQHGDGNMFEFYRKGEWLTKNRIGYGSVAGASDFHNVPTIQNNAPTYNASGSYQNVQWIHGSQWQYIGTDDPVLVAKSFTNDYDFLTGDATNLYNSASDNATDVAYANRSILWVKPDYIVVYDRLGSKTAGKFKRFWLNFQNQPTISGKLTTGTTPGGQKLYVSTLLPLSSTLSVDSGKMDDLGYNQDASGEFMKYRLKVEATGNPLTTRFLHVLQGADGGASVDTATLVQSSAGTAFDGAVFSNMVVLFPVDLGTVTSTTYTVPATVTKSTVTGLTPNAGYTLSTQMVNGSKQVTLTSGGPSTADAGGVLSVNM